MITTLQACCVLFMWIHDESAAVLASLYFVTGKFVTFSLSSVAVTSCYVYACLLDPSSLDLFYCNLTDLTCFDSFIVLDGFCFRRSRCLLGSFGSGLSALPQASVTPGPACLVCFHQPSSWHSRDRGTPPGTKYKNIRARGPRHRWGSSRLLLKPAPEAHPCSGYLRVRDVWPLAKRPG